ncbi:MAG: SusC/RagA family TonB-linked outer membrane protein, partial [Bacteroidales bacterium]|nr:SusC/RagA family TonB-linked outer membrane protein [Bacteroidales bacterium]
SVVSFNSYVSMNSPTNLPKLMNVEQDYRFLAERRRYAVEDVGNTWGSTSLADYTPEVVLSNVLSSPWEKTVLDLYHGGGVNWFDLIMQNSVTQNYELSASGGSGNTSFIISLGFMDENGLLKNDNLKRYNGRININHKITDKINAGANLQFTYRDWDRRADNVYSQLIKMHSMAQPFLANGDILDRPSELAVSHTNPLLNEVEGFYGNNTLSSRLFGSLYFNWEIIKGLQFKSTLGIDGQSGRQGIYEDFMCTANYQFGRGSSFSSESDQGMKYTLENTLTYTLAMGASELQLLAGQAAQRYIYESHRTYGFGLQDHYTKTSFYSLQSILSTGRQLEDVYTESSMLSYFGRVNYKLLGKYLFTATIRTDGSSVLAEGNKWDYFPSLAAAWVISDESFMNSVQAVDLMKLRLSWGRAGNSAVDPYMTKTRLGTTTVPYTFGSTLINGIVPAILGNPEVTWETTSTYDAGIDVSLWRERVTATVDAYYSRTFDLLLYKGLPATSVYPQ